MATKADIAQHVANTTGLTRKDADTAVNAALEGIESTLVKGESLQIIGFGSFEVKERAARIGINPKTQEKIEIPAKKVVSFKPGKRLKDAVQ